MAYAGDMSCRDAWEVLRADAAAQLVDVRTSAEWNFVGIPDLGELAREPILVEWQTYPSMAVNAGFVEILSARLAALGAGKATPLVFLCRSGARSASAATAMAASGYSKAYNIAGGFEGARDPQGHRATINGWKFDGLPWVQG